MATPPLAESLALAKSYGNEPSKCGFELCRHILLGVRDARAHRPDLVLKFGGYLLKHHASSLSHEVWAAYEQVYIALLEHGRYATRRTPTDDADSAEMRAAQEYITVLSAQFPDSSRVKRLEGMMCEAKGELNSAADEYHALRREDAFNISALKRQVAVARSRGKPAEAVEILAEHVATFTQVKGGVQKSLRALEPMSLRGKPQTKT